MARHHRLHYDHNHHSHHHHYHHHIQATTFKLANSHWQLRFGCSVIHPSVCAPLKAEGKATHRHVPWFLLHSRMLLVTMGFQPETQNFPPVAQATLCSHWQRSTSDTKLKYNTVQRSQKNHSTCLSTTLSNRHDEDEPCCCCDHCTGSTTESGKFVTQSDLYCGSRQGLDYMDFRLPLAYPIAPVTKRTSFLPVSKIQRMQ